MTFDVTEVRKDFPILTKKNRGKPLHLDNAASTQKPRTVIEKLSKFYCEQNSNVHRGVYALAEEAENEYHKSGKLLQIGWVLIPMKLFLFAVQLKNLT